MLCIDTFLDTYVTHCEDGFYDDVWFTRPPCSDIYSDDYNTILNSSVANSALCLIIHFGILFHALLNFPSQHDFPLVHNTYSMSYLWPVSKQEEGTSKSRLWNRNTLISSTLILDINKTTFCWPANNFWLLINAEADALLHYKLSKNPFYCMS